MNVAEEISIEERALADHKWVEIACELARHVQRFGWANNLKMELLQNRLIKASAKCECLYKHNGLK